MLDDHFAAALPDYTSQVCQPLPKGNILLAHDNSGSPQLSWLQLQFSSYGAQNCMQDYSSVQNQHCKKHILILSAYSHPRIAQSSLPFWWYKANSVSYSLGIHYYLCRSLHHTSQPVWIFTCTWSYSPRCRAYHSLLNLMRFLLPDPWASCIIW